MKRLVCFLIGHDPDVVTAYETDVSNWPEVVHIFIQIKRCVRCGKELMKPIVSKL